jgi:hypothetical protein
MSIIDKYLYSSTSRICNSFETKIRLIKAKERISRCNEVTEKLIKDISKEEIFEYIVEKTSKYLL